MAAEDEKADEKAGCEKAEQVEAPKVGQEAPNKNISNEDAPAPSGAFNGRDTRDDACASPKVKQEDVGRGADPRPAEGGGAGGGASGGGDDGEAQNSAQPPKGAQERAQQEGVATVAMEHVDGDGDRGGDPRPAAEGGGAGGGDDVDAAQEGSNAQQPKDNNAQVGAQEEAQEDAQGGAQGGAQEEAAGGPAGGLAGGVQVLHSGVHVHCADSSIPREHVIEVIEQLQLSSFTPVAQPLLLLRNETFANGERDQIYMLIGLGGRHACEESWRAAWSRRAPHAWPWATSGRCDQ